MKPKAALRAVDGEKIADTIRRALTCAGLDTTSGPMLDVNDTIRRALSSAGMWNHDAAALKTPSATAGAKLRLVRSLPAMGKVAADPSCVDARALPVRISRMSVHGFIACQANISVDVGPRFHGMPVQDDAGRWIVSESSFGVNDCRC